MLGRQCLLKLQTHVLIDLLFGRKKINRPLFNKKLCIWTMEYYAAYTNERGGVLGADGGLFAKHGSVNESWCRRVCVVPRHVWEKRGDRIFYTVLYAKKKVFVGYMRTW